jgi:hypothetical protein
MRWEFPVPSVNHLISGYWRTNATVSGDPPSTVSLAAIVSLDARFGALSKLRSITMHPLGFLLTDLLNRKQKGDGLELPTQLEKFRSHHDETGETL